MAQSVSVLHSEKIVSGKMFRRHSSFSLSSTSRILPSLGLLMPVVSAEKQPCSCSALRRPYQPYRLRNPSAAAIDEKTLEAPSKAAPVEPESAGPKIARFVVPEFVLTRSGVSLALVGSTSQLGAWDGDKALPMIREAGQHKWTADLALQPGWRGAVEFKLVLLDERGATFETGSNRLFLVDGTEVGEQIEIECVWGSTTSIPETLSPISPNDEEELLPEALADCHIIVPCSPGCSPLFVERVCLVGAGTQLGSWNPDQAPELTYSSSGVWTASVKLPIGKLVEAKVSFAQQPSQHDQAQPQSDMKAGGGTDASELPHCQDAAYSSGFMSHSGQSSPCTTSGTEPAASGTAKFPRLPESVVPLPPPSPDPGVTPTISNSGDFIMMLHWGRTSHSQVVHRGAMDHRYNGCVSPTAANAVVHFSVPSCPTQLVEHLVLVGSHPKLGSWDPANGLMLDWVAEDLWTASVELPVEELEFKLAMFNGSKYCWEPSSPLPEPNQTDQTEQLDTFTSEADVSKASPTPSPNRLLDISSLLKSGSPTGAGNVHVACHWGDTQLTPAVVIPQPPPTQADVTPQPPLTLDVEAVIEEREPFGESSSSTPSTPTTAILPGSDADHHMDEILINLFSFLVAESMQALDIDVFSSQVLINLFSFLVSGSMQALDVDVLINLFSFLVSGSMQALDVDTLEKVLDLEGRLSELSRQHMAELAYLGGQLEQAGQQQRATEGREQRLRKDLKEAVNDSDALKAKMANEEASKQSKLHAAVQRHHAGMVEVSSSYETRILDVQRGYEARIRQLQDHESRIVEMQQAHGAIVSDLEQQHKLESHAQAVALQEQARQHELASWVQNKAAEASAQVAVEAMSETLEGRLAAEREQEIAEGKAATAEAVARAESCVAQDATSALARTNKEHCAELQKLERRSLFLAQALAKKQLDNDELRSRLWDSGVRSLGEDGRASMPAGTDAPSTGAGGPGSSGPGGLNKERGRKLSLKLRLKGGHHAGSMTLPTFFNASRARATDAGAPGDVAHTTHAAQAHASVSRAMPSGAGSTCGLNAGDEKTPAHDDPCMIMYGNNIVTMSLEDIGVVSWAECMQEKNEFEGSLGPVSLAGGERYVSFSAFALFAWLSVLQQQIPLQQ
eukprot:gene15781-21904_t